MGARKKAWWLLVPAAGVVGALFLPMPDEFAFLEGGTPVCVEGFRERREDWRTIYPLPGARERADAVEQALDRRLSPARGWEQNGTDEMYEVEKKGQERVVRTSKLYQNVDIGGVAAFVRYLRPGAAPTCAVIVREPRDAWGRFKHLGRRVFGR